MGEVTADQPWLHGSLPRVEAEGAATALHVL